MKKQLTGTGVAIVTPFTKEGNVDYSSLEKIIHHIMDGGCDYIVSLGTTGESVTLIKEEKKEILSFTRKTVSQKVGLVAGIGGNNTADILKQMVEFDAEGFDAILSVSPYYNKPTQEGIYQHYMQLVEASPLPIIIYNVPGRTSSNISAETTLRLANASEKFAGVKEASGNLIQMMHIVKDKPKDFLVLSGDDPLTLPGISFGMQGVISVVANAYPKEISAMVNTALKGNFDKAAAIHLRFLEITEMMFAEGNPAGVKSVLHQLGLCENVVRLPLVTASHGLSEKIKMEITNLAK